MLYSGVPATNRSLCFIGKAWALKSDPFTWHQDPQNPVFGPGKQGWDSGSIRLDAVLYIPEEDAYYEWLQAFKIGETYLLSIEVGISAGKHWRPVIAVSRHPDTGWQQLDEDTVLQTKWEGLYRDDTIYHVATPAFYQIKGKWFLYSQACPLTADGNYIDGQWDMWCFACDRAIPTLPGCDSLYIPGQP